MKRCFFLLLWIFTIQSALADGPIYLPILTKGDSMAINPILRITNGTDVIDLLGNNSGWELEDPYWNPQIAQYKSGGSYVNSGLAEGQRLVHKEYDNVIETIPLSARGIDQNKSIQTVRRLLQMAKQASDYWTKSYEYDDVWIEARPACNDCLTGYARIVKMSIPEIANPYGQPFFSSFNDAILNGITLTIEREPLWRGLPPGEILGPMYNLLKNPDFELWNFGVADSQPDSWSDLETLQITGQNSREATTPNSGQYALKIRVSGSTAAGKAKGVTQIVESTKNNTEYTMVAHVRSEGVSNGVGRILVTYSGQLEVYRSSDRHGWSLYIGKFTTGVSDVVSINLEILTTAANTDGTIYIDSLMLLEGDFEEAAANGTLPYMTSSHIVNHWDQPGGALVEAGDINFVDVWDVPGDEDALVRLEFQNNTTPANPSAVVENFAKVIAGQRRTGNVFRFDNYHDPTGATDATASSNDRVDTPAIGPNWSTVTGNVITGAENTRANVGRYRVLARVYDSRAGTPNLQARLSYYLGAAGVGRKILQATTAPIRGDWCMLDLTPNKAMTQEQKQAVDAPAQLGYIVEMMRPTGTDTARLDYVLSVPTDGGYIKADIDPSLTQGNILVVDNTSSLQVSGTYKRAGWNTFLTNNTLNAFADLRQFNGSIYAVGVAITPSRAFIYKQVGSSWTNVLSWPSGFAFALEEYNGKLYTGLYDSLAAIGGGYLYQSSNGVTWSSATQIAGYHLIRRMIAFSGKLFIGATHQSGTPASIFTWDGSSLVSTVTLPAGEQVESFAVYGGNLYAGTIGPIADCALWRYNPTTGVWVQLISFPGRDGIESMTEFDGKLYLAFLGGNGIWAYDGLSATQVFDPAGSLTYYQATAIIEHNQKLYVGIRNAAGTSATVLISSDGITWERAIGLTASITSIQGFDQIDGLLYLSGTSGGIGVVLVLTDADIIYTITDFQGGSFTAPPRRFADPRRHRWVFSYDRENYINNADDKALIGIGYVPRYLTLRGAN